MILDRVQKEKCEKIRSMLLRLYDKNDLHFCEKCDGTGLDYKKLKNGDKFWDMISYCDNCYGVGINRQYYKSGSCQVICKCNGIGCELCNNTGYMDWVTVILNGIVPK